MLNARPMLEMHEVEKHYQHGDKQTTALPPFSLTVHAGEIVALVGASGSGKSTLMHIAGLLLQPSSGTVHIAQEACLSLDDTARTTIRREKLGFVYQFHHLLPELTAYENIAVPLILSGTSKAHQKEAIDLLLEDVEMTQRATHMPSELSGGEKQRIAIARALIHSPALLLADEPTGNLDATTSRHVEEVMKDTLRRRHAAALIVTHDEAMANRMDRVIRIG